MQFRNKIFSYCAGYLALKGIPFKFSGEYIHCSNFDLSTDSRDQKKMWIEYEGEWKSFTDLNEFKEFMKNFKF